MVTIKVNGSNDSLVHKGSSHYSKATIPDVCKTPSPGGPVPVPYPNISMSSSLAKGTTTVKADGGNMIAVKGSEFSMSQGDEPGTAGGVKSSTFKKESTWITYSFDVKMDGKNACRLTDKKFQNHENTANMSGAGGITVEAIAKFTKTLCRFLKECTEAHDKGQPPDKAKCDAPGKSKLYYLERGDAIDQCCKKKIEDKKPKGSVVQTKAEMPVLGGTCYPDVVVGSPPCPAVYDFKTSCPPKPPGAKPPNWPKYGDGTGFTRFTANEDWRGKTQAEVYNKACGKEPTMIHANSPECKE